MEKYGYILLKADWYSRSFCRHCRKEGETDIVKLCCSNVIVISSFQLQSFLYAVPVLHCEAFFILCLYCISLFSVDVTLSPRTSC